jgi:hypothetical protein
MNKRPFGDAQMFDAMSAAWNRGMASLDSAFDRAPAIRT